MTHQPLVSIVIPAFNCADTIADAVDSALGQTYGGVEVIVVDDGSTDPTLEVLEGFGERISIVRSSHGGIAHTREVGHEASRGDFIAWLDADDIAEPHRIEVQVRVLAHLQNVVVVSSDFTSFDDGGTRDGSARDYYARLGAEGAVEAIYDRADTVRTNAGSWPVRRALVRDELPFGNFVHPPTVMVRREALAAAPFPGASNLPSADDWLRLVSLADLDEFAFIDAPLLRYRRSPSQISANGLRGALDALEASEIIFDRRPDLDERFPLRVRQALGNRHATVAEAMCDESGLPALSHLLKSVRYQGPSTTHARTAWKAVMPRALLRAFRRSRGLHPVGSTGVGGNGSG